MNRTELNKLSKSQLIELMLSPPPPSSPPSSSSINNVVKWGKKQVENWGNWLMKGAKWGLTKSSNLIKNLGEWFMNVDEDEEDYETAPEDEEDEEAYFTAEEGDEEEDDDAVDIRLLDQALQGYAKSYEISIKNNQDPLLQLQKTRIALESHIESLLSSMNGLKFLESLKVTLSKILDGEIIYNSPVFFSTPQTIMNNTEIKAALEGSQQIILNKIAVWISEGSGWTIESVNHHYLNVVQYQPLAGSSYIDLPEELENKKGLINLQNKDQECFRWCHIRHLNPQETHPERIKKVDREYIKNLNYSGIKFPVTIKQYNKIEKQNNININVFGYEEKDKLQYPIYISKEKNEDVLNLLLITNEEEEEGIKVGEELKYRNHYVLIKDFNKFMFSITKHKNKKHFCMHCLQHFTNERILNNHKENCILINGTQGIKMPTNKENILKFNGFEKQLPIPFVIYADFEAITEKIPDNEEIRNELSYTKAYQNHHDCGYGYKVVCCYDDKFTKEAVIYRGEKAVYKFLEAMLKEVKYCREVKEKNFNKELKMTKDDEEKFIEADRCHICEQKFLFSLSNCCYLCKLQFTEKKSYKIAKYKQIVLNCKECKKKFEMEAKKVRDHCHITGKYRGAAHVKCNLHFRITNKIPVIFHNLRGYDSHFIIQEIGKIIQKHPIKLKGKDGKEIKKDMKINIIPNNMEKYLAIMLEKHLTFIDSFQFMGKSLDKLASYLPKESFKYTSKRFIGEKLDLMTRKGVYPYDYMDSFDKFNEPLPKKEEFFSILNNEHITDKDYKHTLKVWKTFNLKNMGEYHDLYLTSDILLLADVFENFRKTCLEYYKLDPCHYFTSPGLAWDGMLKMTKIKLELLTDVDMYLFIEKGLRGGISYIANRYGKANNKYMNEYNEEEPSKYIMYLDANNLYGWAMSKYLPTSGFEWLTKQEIEDLELSEYKADSEKGLILEVDLEYPKELHDLHNDYPLAPEKIKVNKDMLSDYSQKMAEKFNISTGLVHKLIPTLRKKEKYVLHYRNLKLYMSLGLKLTKIHRVLRFNQSPWLKPYIDFNTQKRSNAKNPFEQEFFKLMNNSVFGKTMENIRKRVNIKLVTDAFQLLKWSSKPTFVSFKIFDEDLIAVHKIKEQIKLNKPAYVGMCILDISKTLMYFFHYLYIKQNYKAKLLFTDTDSLAYEIEAEDVYEDLWKDKDLFDYSDYHEKSPYFYKKNKKVIGKFKDEAKGIIITEFVGLRSKMYSYKKDVPEHRINEPGMKIEPKTAKGIKKNVIENDLKFNNYKETLFNNNQMHHKMKTIRSQNHQIKSYEINKVSLSSYDDKRYILDDGIHSYAYGHYAIL